MVAMDDLGIASVVAEHRGVRNAHLFHQRWNAWPMHGWLDAFAERGLLTFDGSR